MLNCDVLICGGAVIGSSAAWFLAKDPDFDGSIVVVEPDPSYRQAATALSASGIRQQFSSPLNIRISQFGAEFLHESASHFGQALTFRENGYLYLAANTRQESALRRNHATQAQLGAGTVLLEPQDLAQRFAHLNLDDILLGSLGTRGEGWFDNMGLLAGFRSGARQCGVTYLQDRVSGLVVDGYRVRAAVLASGDRISCGHFINAAGVRGAEIAAMAGIDIPVRPRKRTNFLFACASPPQGKLPLMIDPGGVWCRPEGEFFLCGSAPEPDPDVAPDDLEPNHAEFDEVIWPALARRSPNFEAIRVQRFWAGLYDLNSFDHNVIVGPHDQIGNFLLANGFSGHGLQQSPAIGRGLAEWIAHGSYRSLDLTPLGFDRIRSGQAYPEANVI